MRQFENKVIEQRKRFLTKFWNGEEVNRPACQFMSYSGNFQNIAPFNTMLKQFEDHFSYNVNYPGDYIPVIWPYLGVSVLAEAFGCRQISLDGNQPHAEAIIKNEPQKVYSLRKPELSMGTLGRVFEFVEYVQKQTNYPIRLTDIQGPLDLSAQIWGDAEFCVALYEHPKEVNYLMDMVTEFLIAVFNEHKRVIKDFVPVHWPLIWVPKEAGMGISEDLLAVISPSLCEKYAVPRWNRISDACNGIHLHSCGRFTHNLPALKQIKNLRSLNFSIAQNGAFEQGNPMEVMVQAFNNTDTVLIPVIDELSMKKYSSRREFYQHILNCCPQYNRLYLLIAAGGNGRDFEGVEDIKEMLYEKFGGF